MRLDEEEFQEWLKDMDYILGEFFGELPASVNRRMDYSIESLDALEAWLLARFDDNRLMLHKSETLVLDGSARYIGQTFIRHLGGYWYMERDEKNVYHGLPVLDGFGDYVAPTCPVTLATACVDRRFGDFISGLLRTSITNQREQRRYELSIKRKK